MLNHQWPLTLKSAYFEIKRFVLDENWNDIWQKTIR